jgi:hypothetical protein
MTKRKMSIELPTDLKTMIASRKKSMEDSVIHTWDMMMKTIAESREKKKASLELAKQMKIDARKVEYGSKDEKKIGIQAAKDASDQLVEEATNENNAILQKYSKQVRDEVKETNKRNKAAFEVKANEIKAEFDQDDSQERALKEKCGA